MGPDARMISDNDQTALINSFHECEADIMIAGDRYIYPALKSRIPSSTSIMCAALATRDTTA